MAQNTQEQRIINNVKWQLRLVEEAGLPKYVVPNIQPTFQVNDDLVDPVRVSRASRSTEGSTTILTTSATGSTWLTYAMLTWSKGSLEALTNVNITANVNGIASTFILEQAISDGVGTQNVIAVAFPRPLLLTPNTTVVLSTTGTGVGTAIVGTINHVRPNNNG